MFQSLLLRFDDKRWIFLVILWIFDDFVHVDTHHHVDEYHGWNDSIGRLHGLR